MTALSFRAKYKQSISRVLFRFRGDNHLSRPYVAVRLKRRNPEGRRATSTLPYSVLLRVGFAKPDSHLPAGALLPHLSTLAWHGQAVSFSMALSLGSPPLDVIQHTALRSPDFPHLPFGSRDCLDYLY